MLITSTLRVNHKKNQSKKISHVTSHENEIPFSYPNRTLVTSKKRIVKRYSNISLTTIDKRLILLLIITVECYSSS